LAQVEGELVLACSGREGGFCTEDTVFAGACVAALAETQLTDAAETAKLLYQTHREDLLGMLKNCYHGRSLANIGLGEDLEFCAQMNLVDVVPHLVDGRIIV
jgi:2-phosphosulfolactate phosphatase